MAIENVYKVKFKKGKMAAKILDPRCCKIVSACLIDNKLKNIPTLNKQSFCCKFLFMNTWADHVARLLDNITYCARADSE